MKYALLFVIFIFFGCSNFSSISKKSLPKCYVHKIPAPIWMCKHSSFMEIGVVKTKKNSLLNEEIAYSKGINKLIIKLQTKTAKLLRKLNIKDKKILDDVKSYVIINSNEKSKWYDKKDKLLYVLVEIDKNDFEDFLQKRLKVNKKIFKKIFDENF